jgi:hypothetical protein
MLDAARSISKRDFLVGKTIVGTRPISSVLSYETDSHADSFAREVRPCNDHFERRTSGAKQAAEKCGFLGRKQPSAKAEFITQQLCTA